MLLSQLKFARLSSHYLRNFKEKSSNPYLFNFSCPFCGDSNKQKSKARGYLYQKDNSLFYKCHNCSVSVSFANFLKECSIHLYDEFILENFDSKFKREKKINDDFYIDLKNPPKLSLIQKYCIAISDLAPDHPVKIYAMERKLNLFRFYQSDHLLSLVNEINKKYSKITNGENRVVIPFYNENNILSGIQTRDVLSTDKRFRYETFKSQDHNMIFGINYLDYRLPIYVLEGPFDSSFIKNSIAVASSNLKRVTKILGKDHDYIFVFDNEPRNQEIVKEMLAVVKMGYKIVIYPDSVKEKDINDMVLSNHDISELIKYNIYQGLEAELKLGTWKKI